ncbi:MAG: tetratricopeptide repeat protein [Thermodesulfobacteriota bacterium]
MPTQGTGSPTAKEALKAFEDALKVRTIQSSPMQFAATQNNLGIVYRMLSDIEDRARNCKRAIDAYETALIVYSADKFPLEYRDYAQQHRRSVFNSGRKRTQSPITTRPPNHIGKPSRSSRRTVSPAPTKSSKPTSNACSSFTGKTILPTRMGKGRSTALIRILLHLALFGIY